MRNIVCYTQDVPGERDWINSQFPGYINLETESAGRWGTDTSSGGFIREVAKNDIDCCDFNFIDGLDAKFVKTIYNNNLDLVIHDNIILKADELLVNNNIKFLNNNFHIKNYMMFTFTRCGTVFTESILRQKYPNIRHEHYGPPDFDKVDVIKEFCLHNNNVRICLNYRSSWWNWLTSQIIMTTNKNATTRGALHYSDNINWDDLKSSTINKEHFDFYEKTIINTFTFWIQLRLVLPTHQFSLFRFEDILPLYQSKTDHKQIPYNKNKLITNYSEAHKIFTEHYLPKWQSIEKKALRFLKQLNVSPTVNI